MNEGREGKGTEGKGWGGKAGRRAPYPEWIWVAFLDSFFFDRVWRVLNALSVFGVLLSHAIGIEYTTSHLAMVQLSGVYRKPGGKGEGMGRAAKPPK